MAEGGYPNSHILQTSKYATDFHHTSINTIRSNSHNNVNSLKPSLQNYLDEI